MDSIFVTFFQLGAFVQNSLASILRFRSSEKFDLLKIFIVKPSLFSWRMIITTIRNSSHFATSMLFCLADLFCFYKISSRTRTEPFQVQLGVKGRTDYKLNLCLLKSDIDLKVLFMLISLFFVCYKNRLIKCLLLTVPQKVNNFASADVEFQSIRPPLATHCYFLK